MPERNKTKSRKTLFKNFQHLPANKWPQMPDRCIYFKYFLCVLYNVHVWKGLNDVGWFSRIRIIFYRYNGYSAGTDIIKIIFKNMRVERNQIQFIMNIFLQGGVLAKYSQFVVHGYRFLGLIATKKRLFLNLSILKKKPSFLVRSIGHFYSS